jgi:hypothetical protein
MKQLRRIAAVTAVTIASLVSTSGAQTRNVIFVTNAYDLKLQQFSTGSVAGAQYASFSGEAKAVNNKAAADLKPLIVSLYYGVSADGILSVTGGTFMFQITNKDRSTLTVGGDIPPGAALTLLANGAIAGGQSLSLSLVGSAGTDISGVITATIDKSTPPRVAGTLTLTYPVVQ